GLVKSEAEPSSLGTVRRVQRGQYFLRSRTRVLSGANWPADHQPVRAGGERFRRRQRALLIVLFLVGWTNARCDQLDIGGNDLSQPCNLQRRANESTQTGPDRQGRQSLDLMADIRIHPDLREFVAVEARQDRHAQDQRWRAAQPLGRLLRGLLGGAHHLASA